MRIVGTNADSLGLALQSLTVFGNGRGSGITLPLVDAMTTHRYVLNSRLSLGSRESLRYMMVRDGSNNKTYQIGKKKIDTTVK